MVERILAILLKSSKIELAIGKKAIFFLKRPKKYLQSEKYSQRRNIKDIFIYQVFFSRKR